GELPRVRAEVDLQLTAGDRDLGSHRGARGVPGDGERPGRLVLRGVDVLPGDGHVAVVSVRERRTDGGRQVGGRPGRGAHLERVLAERSELWCLVDEARDLLRAQRVVED